VAKDQVAFSSSPIGNDFANAVLIARCRPGKFA
jgi:hypothetical protein